MKFRILGPLEVTSDGGSPRLGGPKPRAILAALLLHRGAVVSADALVHAAWGNRAPRDATGTLQAYISRLRSVLDPSGSGVLRHLAPGYVLEVSEDDLDAAQFSTLVARGLQLAQEAHREEAVEVFGSALDLWRGEPLAEFDTAYVDPDAWLARLHELRLVAMEERSQLMVRLGRGREVTAELEALVERHPERERLAVVLMEALYAGGRQSDALAVYRRLRSHLAEDLGVEPSESARSAHLKVLSHDPSLATSGSLPPANLPRPRTGLVGRAADVSQVTASIEQGSLVTLTGVGGVGKSRLALEVAGLERVRFTDGTWWVELAPVGPGAVDRALATALGVQQHQGRSMEETLVEYLGDRNALVVLDNCEHVLPEVVPLVDRLLSHCPRLAILATSRETLAADGEHVWTVEPLSVPEATTLFIERARAITPAFAADPDDTGPVPEICRRLDGLPLAVELAAARTRAMSVSEVLRRLDDEGLLVRGSWTRSVRQRSLTATIDWSYRLLTPAEQQLFTRLSVFAGTARLEAIHAVCGEPPATETATLDLLTALADKSMIVVMTGSGDTRYRVLEMLRAFGRARLTADEVIARRHAAYFTKFAEQVARGAQGPEEAGWIARVLPDVDNLRTAFEHASADGDLDQMMRLCCALPEVLQLRRGYEAAGWAERALELAPVDHPLFVATVGAAARGTWAFGDFDNARLLARRAEGRVPPRGTARIGYPGDVLADISLYDGEVEAALEHYVAAVSAAREQDDPIRLVWSLYYVAVCHAVRRQPALGRAAAEESLVVAERTANPTARSMARYALGLILKKEDPDRALTLFDEAARLAGSVHNFWWQGIASMEAASTRAVHADPRVAARAFVGVLDHWQRLGDRTQQWLNLRYIVRLLVRLGADEEAVALHHYLLAEGRPSPIDADRAGRLLGGLREDTGSTTVDRGRNLSITQAVGFARNTLRELASA
jgi:predicted ATPase/DNA-binding SARP family transcriptional activator